MDQACQIIALAGLKIVPQSYICVPEEEMNALLVLAKGRICQASSVADLWADEEPE